MSEGFKCAEPCSQCRMQGAAALRAAADQVVPEQRPWHRTVGEPAARHKVRCKLLALATELKGVDSRPPDSPCLFDTSTKEQKPPPRFT
jgi:hypothetical protein